MKIKVLKINDSEFSKIKELTDGGWRVEKVTKISDSQSEYMLTKPDTTKKIKG